MHRWWVFLHVAGVFGFLMAHGISAYVTFRLRRERDPARVSHLLELSASSVGAMWNAIGVLLLGGIVAGFTGHFWGQAWIWVAIGLFVAVIAAMYGLGTTWARRLRTIAAAMTEGTEAVSPQQFDDILRSQRPYTIAGIGFAGLLVILWLMIFKPTFGLGGGEAALSCPPPGRAIQICAVDDRSFVTRTVRAPAGEPFEIVFVNRDVGVEHNVSIYSDRSAEESLSVGEYILGDGTGRYSVPALDPSSYFFRCDIHPVMTGTLDVS